MQQQRQHQQREKARLQREREREKKARQLQQEQQKWDQERQQHQRQPFGYGGGCHDLALHVAGGDKPSAREAVGHRSAPSTKPVCWEPIMPRERQKQHTQSEGRHLLRRSATQPRPKGCLSNDSTLLCCVYITGSTIQSCCACCGLFWCH